MKNNTNTKINQYLENLDLIQNPSNSDMNEFVVYLLNNHVLEILDNSDKADASRLIRAALRLRSRYLSNTTGSSLDHYKKYSLDDWLSIQMSRYCAN